MPCLFLFFFSSLLLLPLLLLIIIIVTVCRCSCFTLCVLYMYNCNLFNTLALHLYTDIASCMWYVLVFFSFVYSFSLYCSSIRFIFCIIFFFSLLLYWNFFDIVFVHNQIEQWSRLPMKFFIYASEKRKKCCSCSSFETILFLFSPFCDTSNILFFSFFFLLLLGSFARKILCSHDESKPLCSNNPEYSHDLWLYLRGRSHSDICTGNALTEAAITMYIDVHASKSTILLDASRYSNHHVNEAHSQQENSSVYTHSHQTDFLLYFSFSLYVYLCVHQSWCHSFTNIYFDPYLKMFALTWCTRDEWIPQRQNTHTKRRRMPVHFLPNRRGGDKLNGYYYALISLYECTTCTKNYSRTAMGNEMNASFWWTRAHESDDAT